MTNETHQAIQEVIKEIEDKFLRSFDAHRHHISKKAWTKLKKKHEDKSEEIKFRTMIEN